MASQNIIIYCFRKHNILVVVFVRGPPSEGKSEGARSGKIFVESTGRLPASLERSIYYQPK